MTCQEVRFIPVRFKDAYGPVGAWFLLFKARATNGLGENYMETRRDELQKSGTEMAQKWLVEILHRRPAKKAQSNRTDNEHNVRGNTGLLEWKPQDQIKKEENEQQHGDNHASDCHPLAHSLCP